jgi:hypothetical protein
MSGKGPPPQPLYIIYIKTFGASKQRRQDCKTDRHCPHLELNTAPLQLIKQLTSCSKILLEKLLASQLVKKLSTFSRTHRFITAFTTALPPQTDCGRSILIISSHLCVHFTSALFLQVLPLEPFI